MRNFEKEIRAHALKNALEHGKAQVERILPKLFQHGLQKKDIPEIIPDIKEIVKEVNSLDKNKQQKALNLLAGYIPEKQEQPSGLPELPNPSKKMVLRLAPFPSGALHIGNAKTFTLNAIYAEKYNGKLILVMDDTIGSEKKPLMKESYKLIEDAFKFLKINHEKKIIYKSNRLKIYYNYAEKLIEKEKAYVCYCSQEELRKNREGGIECGCRQLPKKIQIERWKEMFRAKQGHAVLRIKTNMMHPDPAFRDRVLFKISDRPHPKTKKRYRVWPTLEMSWAIDDHLLGITHIIRGNDLAIETQMEKYLWDIFHWKHPETIHTGLVNLEGADKISKSKAQEEVKSGKFAGWSDPRTWSIQSLEKRGILPEAIRQFVREIGLNKQDITLPIESLYSINRRMIDSASNRFSFIADPIKITIKDRPQIKTIQVPVHPEKKETRTVRVGEISVSKSDFTKLKGKEVRLLHLYNVKLDKQAKLTSTENKNIPKINWVSHSVPATILMPDGKTVKGIAEEGIKTLKNSEVLQFERFGFVKLNKKGSEYNFWFAHR